jgi:hypothetical protein
VRRVETRQERDRRREDEGRKIFPFRCCYQRVASGIFQGPFKEGDSKAGAAPGQQEIDLPPSPRVRQRHGHVLRPRVGIRKRNGRARVGLGAWVSNRTVRALRAPAWQPSYAAVKNPRVRSCCAAARRRLK